LAEFYGPKLPCWGALFAAPGGNPFSLPFFPRLGARFSRLLDVPRAIGLISPIMVSPALGQLLILQDRDIRRHGLDAQAKAVPKEIAAVEAKIAAERGAIDAAKAEMRGLESQKKLLETEIGGNEERIAKYRTQQLSVKKNDEYQALGHEIETALGKNQELEGKELELMYSIDSAKGRFQAAEATLKANITGHETKISVLKERGVNLAAELTAAEADFAASRAPLGDPDLRIYDRVAARNLPAVVAIRGGKCGGCHLKVSSEVESTARGKAPVVGFPTCDQCGRIVYWES
jgi:uncharacterized protein